MVRADRPTRFWRNWYCERAVPSGPAAAPTTPNRFVRERLVFYAADPVRRVFKSARYGEIVFRGCNDDAVSRPDPVGQVSYDLRHAGCFFIVTVIYRNTFQGCDVYRHACISNVLHGP